MPSSLDDLDDSEYDRLHNENYGIAQGEEEEEGGFDDSNMKVLDGPGIWGAIQEWLYGTLSYPMLLDIIDFQYNHNPKIQYWEDFMSRLAYIEGLEEHQSLFRSISLTEHLACITSYQSTTENPTSTSSLSLPAASEASNVKAKEPTDAWAVKIAPCKWQ